MRAFIKAKLLLISILLVWLTLLFLTLRGWYQLLVTLFSLVRKNVQPYALNLWIAQDQDVNTLFGGNPDITISSRVGFMAKQGSKTARAMEVVINWLFEKAIGQSDHCRKNIEHDEDHVTDFGH
jgi:hypothetical protein